jgi:hypothetical protein
MSRTKLLERGWTRQPCLPLPIRIPHIRDRHLRLGSGFLAINTKGSTGPVFRRYSPGTDFHL